MKGINSIKAVIGYFILCKITKCENLQVIAYNRYPEYILHAYSTSVNTMFNSHLTTLVENWLYSLSPK